MFYLSQVINILVQTGAHITELPTKVGEALVVAGATSNTKRIESFLLAGVDISQHDTLGRTALHAVSCLVLNCTANCIVLYLLFL